MQQHHNSNVSKVPSPAMLVVFVVCVMLVTLGLTLVQTPYYRSRVRILLLQQYGEGMDPYNISKATEYYTNLLAEVVGSRAFFNEVVAEDSRIDQAFFPVSPEKHEKVWQKLVSARPVGDTGILTITVYHPSRLQAESLASAMAHVFVAKGAQFHGAGDRVAIRTIDDPVTSEKPVTPVIWLHVLIALIAASLIAIAWRMYSVARHQTHEAPHEEEYFLR